VVLGSVIAKQLLETVCAVVVAHIAGIEPALAVFTLNEAFSLEIGFIIHCRFPWK
jgi:hypothetical protein